MMLAKVRRSVGTDAQASSARMKMMLGLDYCWANAAYGPNPRGRRTATLTIVKAVNNRMVVSSFLQSIQWFERELPRWRMCSLHSFKDLERDVGM